MKSRRKSRRRSSIVLSSQLKLLLTMMIVLVLSIVLTVLSNPNMKGDKMEHAKYTVKGGDTVWDIADLYYDNSVDIRDMIHLIEDINDISDSRIYQGEVLLVPVYAE